MSAIHFYDNTAARTAAKTAPGMVARAVETLMVWRDRARGRQMLGTLDEHMLRDIGINRAIASTEAEKPFWRP
jgi:uncharacterized protein YjiS (DUF1127 family)